MAHPDEIAPQLDQRFAEIERRLAWIETLENDSRELAEQARRRKIEGDD